MIAVKNNCKIRLLVLIVVIAIACQGLPAAAPNTSSVESPVPSSDLAASAVQPVSSTPELFREVETPRPLRLEAVFQDERLEAPPAVLNRRIPYLAGSSGEIEPFNNFINGIVAQESEEFRKGLSDWEAYPDLPAVPSTFLSGYSVYTANAHLASLKLEFVVYLTGAAHPFSYVRTVNYDLREDRAITLDEVFKPGSNYLDFLSRYCEDELAIDLDQAFFKEGLAPVEDNFQSWGLTRESLVVEFDPYQVAPYASGPQQVVIPFENLKDMLDPEGPAGWTEAPELEIETGEVPPEWPTPAP